MKILFKTVNAKETRIEIVLQLREREIEREITNDYFFYYANTDMFLCVTNRVLSFHIL